MRRKGMRFPNGIPRAETELLQVDTSVHSSLRGRISEVLREFLRCDGDGYRDGGREWVNIDNMADAVIHDALTPEFLADLVIAAVRKAADDE